MISLLLKFIPIFLAGMLCLLFITPTVSGTTRETLVDEEYRIGLPRDYNWEFYEETTLYINFNADKPVNVFLTREEGHRDYWNRIDFRYIVEGSRTEAESGDYSVDLPPGEYYLIVESHYTLDDPVISIEVTAEYERTIEGFIEEYFLCLGILLIVVGFGVTYYFLTRTEKKALDKNRQKPNKAVPKKTYQSTENIKSKPPPPITPIKKSKSKKRSIPKNNTDKKILKKKLPMKLCPDCNNELEDDWITCGFCGKKLLKRCPECNQKMPLSFDKCKKCGYEFSIECSKCGKDIPFSYRDKLIYCTECGEKLE